LALGNCEKGQSIAEHQKVEKLSIRRKMICETGSLHSAAGAVNFVRII